MNKFPELTQKVKFQLLKKEVSKLISKNEHNLIFDDKLEILFNTLVDDAAVSGLLKKETTKDKKHTTLGKSFNWSQYFQRESISGNNHDIISKLNPKTEHNRKPGHNSKDNSNSIIASVDELDLEKFEYMVFDTITETSWNLKVIDLPYLKIKKESSIFTIINENNFRDPFQVMNNISKYTKVQDKSKNWSLFGTNFEINTQIILRRYI